MSAKSSKDCDYALGLYIPGTITINVPIIKSFAKRNISLQFKSLISILTIGYLGLPIFSPNVALGFGRAKFMLRGRRPSGPTSLVAALRNCLKTLSTALNTAKRATRTLLKRGETIVVFFCTKIV